MSGIALEDLVRLLLLRDYNTRIVLMGTVLLGTSAGVVGTLMLLRKRSLLGDVISHAALPGIACAFLLMEFLGAGSGKWLPGLLGGALVTGLLGILCTSAIRRWTRIKEDAALAVVLSVFFGVGVALLTVIQDIPTGTAAGLNSFIYGKAASLVASDVKLIAGSALAVLLLTMLVFKELKLLCFDERFAASEGWPTGLLDLVLMSLVLVVTVIGLQSVGLLLMVAMLIIPAAAARFWSDHLGALTLIAALIGATSAYCGVAVSALLPRMAAGAIIVLVSSCCFGISLLLGVRRGVLQRWARHVKLRRRVAREHLLRAFYEAAERLAQEAPLDFAQLRDCSITEEELLKLRSWTPAQLRRTLRGAERQGLLVSAGDRAYTLSALGAREAHRTARNHRLWELYLIHQADVAPSVVDRGADQIEHVVAPEVLPELERLLATQYPGMTMPPSPHALEAVKR